MAGGGRRCAYEGLGLGPSEHVPAAAFLRLTAIEELSGTYDTVIYLDGDVYQAWGSLADLASMDLQGAAIGAVRGRSHWFDDPAERYNIRYIERLSAGIGDRYFNSGVLVVDGRRYADCTIAGKSIEFLRQYPERCRFGDQSALNAVLAGNWAELSPGWNWQMSKTSYGLTGGRCPRLIHFTGRIKPWSDRYRIHSPEIFASMLAMLEYHGLMEVLPDSAPIYYTHKMERTRSRMIADWAGDTLAKRERIKSYLNRRDFADIAAGLESFR